MKNNCGRISIVRQGTLNLFWRSTLSGLSDSFDLNRVVLTRKEIRMAAVIKLAAGVAGDVDETEAFVTLASACDVPLKQVRVRPGKIELLPVSAFGRTAVRFVGVAPMVAAEISDGNLEMQFNGPGAVEVVFSSRGRVAKKKIYVVEQ